MKLLSTLLVLLPLALGQGYPPDCPTTRLWQISSYTSFAAYNATSTASYVSFHFADVSVPSQLNYETDCYHTVPANPDETGPGTPADPNDFITCESETTSFKLTNPYDGQLIIQHEFLCNLSTGLAEDEYAGGSVDLQGLVDCDDSADGYTGESCIADFDMTYDYSNAD